MAQHNRITFTAEYCRSRHIPYRIKREALFIGSYQVCFSLYNHTYIDIIRMIDDVCLYDPYDCYYIGLSTTRNI
jgi:hypothetical protein